MKNVMHTIFGEAHYLGILLALTLWSCSDPLAPVAPEWDADLNVPLIAQTYTMEDLLEQDSTLHIEAGANNILLLRKSFLLDGIALGDRLTWDANNYSYSQKLGALDYTIPDLLDKDILVRDVFPTMSITSGPVQAITNTEAIDVVIDAKEYFEELTFEAGTITFTLTNTLPVPVAFPTPAIVRDENGASLGSIAITGQIAPGATKTLPAFKLDGKTLKADMALDLFVSTPGSGGANVTVKSTQGLHVRAAIENTKILSALAYLPSQTVDYDSKTDITNNNGSYMESGTIRSGTLRFSLFNHIPVGANISLVVKGCYDQNGAELTRDLYMSAHGTKTIDIKLAGYTIAPESGKYLTYSLNIQTDAAETTPVRIKAMDSVSVTATIYSLIFDELNGTLSPQTVSIDQTQNIQFDFASRLTGDITFANAKMWTVLDNRAGLPVRVDNCSITGSLTGSTKTASVSVPEQYIQGNAETTVSFNDNEVLHFLNTFTQTFPDKLTVAGSVLLNPDGNPGTISSKDSIGGVLWVEIPLEFSMKSGIINDTSEITMSKDNKTRMEDVNTGTITFDLENHLPADMVLETTILDHNYNVLLEPRAIDGSEISVASAEVDEMGRTSKATKSTTKIEFNEEEFKKMVLSKWIKVRMRMNTENAQNVAFRSTDYIKVRAYASLNVNSSIVK